jgi:hypothetical protein
VFSVPNIAQPLQEPNIYAYADQGVAYTGYSQERKPTGEIRLRKQEQCTMTLNGKLHMTLHQRRNWQSHDFYVTDATISCGEFDTTFGNNQILLYNATGSDTYFDLNFFLSGWHDLTNRVPHHQIHFTVPLKFHLEHITLFHTLNFFEAASDCCVTLYGWTEEK